MLLQAMGITAKKIASTISTKFIKNSKDQEEIKYGSTKASLAELCEIFIGEKINSNLGEFNDIKTTRDLVQEKFMNCVI